MKNNRKIEVGQVRAAQFGTEYEYWYVVNRIVSKANGQYKDVYVTITQHHNASNIDRKHIWYESCMLKDVVVM
ncbi:hypothetical protein NVP1161O_091 [Vibrio phage 1.161.O._10N.261.48.C5]|nr:hypothetical protein NVP1161O_091 [Vibrio phage 1.161.O._10N.261.48.C5]